MRTPTKEEYYTPEIEEFHNGFEYETQIITNDAAKTGWNKQTFSVMAETNTFPDILPIRCCRVKFLDKADIESLGWKWDNGRFGIIDPIYPSEYKWILILDEDFDNSHLLLISNGKTFSMHFSGTVKNKSELQILMKQIGI